MTIIRYIYYFNIILEVLLINFNYINIWNGKGSIVKEKL